MELPEVEVEAVSEGLAPKLDMVKGASDLVGTGQAQRTGSLAVPAEPEPADPTDAATSAPAAATQAHRDRVVGLDSVPAESIDDRKKKAESDLRCSVFIQLDQDLAGDDGATTRRDLADLVGRARWKLDAGIAVVDARDLEELRAHPAVRYIEPGLPLRRPDPDIATSAVKPPARELRRVSSPRQPSDLNKVLVGIIDVGGFDFAHPDFLRNGSTRWVGIWDQGGSGRPPPSARGGQFGSLDYGAELQADHLEAAVEAAPDRKVSATLLEPQSEMARNSHGTHVASIAAGNRGVARNADIAGVLVSLDDVARDPAASFYDSTRIADAIEYLIALSADLGTDAGPRPLSINISLGTNGHAHDTSSTMSRWIDYALSTPGRCVSVAAGNAGQVEPEGPDDLGHLSGRIHAAGTIAAAELTHDLKWQVLGNQVVDLSPNELEVWYGPQDSFGVAVRPPDGPWSEVVVPGTRIKNRILPDGTMLTVTSELYFPANGLKRISVLLSPFFGKDEDDEPLVVGIAAGEWTVRLTGLAIRDGRFDAWIERDDLRRYDGDTFSLPSCFAPGSYTEDRMLSSLACGERILSVANADVAGVRVAPSSSRGPTRDGRPKPDLAAAGTDVVAAAGFNPGTAWVSMTGTSMASPHVCGLAALMLAVDATLTSAQIQGIMRRTARPLPGVDYRWQPDAGFGLIDAARCLEETIRFRDQKKLTGGTR